MTDGRDGAAMLAAMMWVALDVMNTRELCCTYEGRSERPYRTK
jgi:hypothetical protein